MPAVRKIDILILEYSKEQIAVCLRALTSLLC